VRTQAPNEEQAQYWNGDEAGHWIAHEARYEAMLAPFTNHLLLAAAVGRADHVLDVGCGCGASTRAAGRCAADGDALGVDLSRRLLRRARQRAREEGLANVRFQHADAQVHAFARSAFDVAISRFGVMFFADPAAAFANVARALRPAGRLAMVCWADVVDNEWIAVPGAAVARHVDLPDLGYPGGPGPFSLADPDRLSATLGSAGLAVANIDALSVPLVIGSDVADTVEFLKATGIGQSLLKDATAPAIARVTEAMNTALEPYLTTDGITLGSKSWLVTAQAPGWPA
jgi:SAM-dependent methyltransferase